MKRVRSAIVVIAALATVVAAAPAYGDAPSPAVVIADVEQALDLQPPVPGGSTDTDIVIGTDGTVENAQSAVSIDLPWVSAATSFVEEGGLFVAEDTGSPVTAAVQPEQDGAYRALVHLEGASAPTEIPFRFDLPDGAQLVELADGSTVAISAEGTFLGGVMDPWALDANGEPVSTSYDIRGSTLVQRVNHGPSTAYPVVADPFWVPVAIAVAGHVTRHAAQRMAQRAISRAAVNSALRNPASTVKQRHGTTRIQGYSNGKKLTVIVDQRNGNIVTTYWGW